MNQQERDQLSLRRLSALTKRIAWFKRDLAERLTETKRLFGGRVYAVDIHSHSTHSDGCGTLEENHAAAMNAGLDFLFATDHASLRQKHGVRKWRNASWGQEPGAGGQHIGLLQNRRLFRPKLRSFTEDFQAACAVSQFAWVPHPVGWYPVTWYEDRLIDMLWTIGDAFAVEVMNGAAKAVRAYDAFDRKAVETWDQLLCAGKRVTALGGSDAHCPDEFGSVWTGVFAKQCAAGSILRALQAGSCFASESSLLDFGCGREGMGCVIRKPSGSTIELRFRAADAGGLDSIRLVSGGRCVRQINARRKCLVQGSYRARLGTRPAYYRLESTACDDRRAFSTPIYFLPAR